MLKRLIQKIKHRRFCKLNNYYCPDCIYHHFVWDGVVFRGNVCLYGRMRERREDERLNKKTGCD